MVCIVCNGKGYVTEKERELPCQECQGRGEYLFFKSSSLPNCEPQECSEARRLGAVSA
jgi:DnaJ-class molecular chaperone